MGVSYKKLFKLMIDQGVKKKEHISRARLITDLTVIIQRSLRTALLCCNKRGGHDKPPD